MVLEEVVFITLGAVSALQAANQEYGHTYSDKDSEDTRVDLKPLKQSSHSKRPSLKLWNVTVNPISTRVTQQAICWT